MKKIILSLITIGVAGLLVSASAQPAPGDDNTNNSAPNRHARHRRRAATTRPDAGGPAPTPDEAAAAPEQSQGKRVAGHHAVADQGLAAGRIPV